IVYFTQGSGEADINDRTKPLGMGLITEKLQRRNFDVRPLKLDPLNSTIPDDAKIIVIAGPKQTLPPNAVDALKAFLDKGGKLVGLFDIPESARPEKEMPPTGLEGALAGFGVEVTKDRIQSVPFLRGGESSTDDVLVVVDAAAEMTSLAVPFKNI